MQCTCNESRSRGPTQGSTALARIVFAAGLLAAASLAGGVGVGGRLTLGPHEFASGGGRSASNSFALVGVTGVWQAGASSSETYSVAGGFLEAAGESGPTTPPCPADLTADGAVDGADLATLLGNWANGGVADFDRSGAVDGADLATLLGAWGPCPVS
ncbi:MAG: hypothetical protein JNL80_03045 [Phycisphaerae bacterium]|jgi:hypothetical protein|nr:hypothetical protein [Phycisphaerae bacterium]